MGIKNGVMNVANRGGSVEGWLGTRGPPANSPLIQGPAKVCFPGSENMR